MLFLKDNLTSSTSKFYFLLAFLEWKFSKNYFRYQRLADFEKDMDDMLKILSDVLNNHKIKLNVDKTKNNGDR